MAQEPVKYNPNDDSPALQPEMKPEGGCAEKEPYALQVLGVDMEPQFPDKSIIVIEPYTKALAGAYMVVEVEGEKWFRQYQEDTSGRKYLSACNDLFPDIELNHLNWQVVGIIRQCNIRREIKHFEYPGE